MRRIDDSPLAAQLTREAAVYRGRGPLFAPFAAIAVQLAEIERRIDAAENYHGLRRYLAAGGRLN